MKTIDVEWEEVYPTEEGEVEKTSKSEKTLSRFLDYRANLWAILRWLIAWAILLIVGSFFVK